MNFPPSQPASKLDPTMRFGAKTLPTVSAQLCITLVASFLVITTFEGAIRFYSAKAGVPWLVYLKDVMIFGALAVGVLSTLLTNLRNLSFFVVLIVLLIGVGVGGMVLPDIKQALFAAKTWMPLLCGAAIGGLVDIHAKVLRYTCIVLLLAMLGGMLLTSQWHAPWVGFDYEIGGVTVEGSREWSIGGVNRLAGFSRSSFDAALQCLFLAILVVIGTRNYFINLVIWALSGAVIYLTTSRSAAAALAAAVGLHILVISSRTTQRLAKVGVLFLTLVMVGLPLLAPLYYKNKVVVTESADLASTSSFEDRSTQTWPKAFELQQRGGNPLVGRGLGGIGAAQKIFEPNFYNPADNFLVYMWVALGVLGAGFVAFIPFQIWRAPVPLTKNQQAGTIFIAAFLAIGFTLNGIESAIASLFLGMSLAWLSQRTAYDSSSVSPFNPAAGN